MLLKKILSYGFVEAFAKGLNKLTVLLLPFFLTDVDNFGVIGLIISIEVILPFISLLGLERAILRFYSKRLDFDLFEGTVLSAVNISHIILLLVCGLCHTLGVDEILGIKVFPDLYLVILLVYLQGINTLHLNFYRVEENHTKYFKNRACLQFLKFFLVVLFVYLTQDYLGYLWGGCIAAILTNLFFRTYRSMNMWTIKKSTFYSLISFSWPFIFHGLAGNILGNADRFIIQKYMSLEDVGVYTLAYSFASSIVFAFLGITVYIEPLIYKEEDLDRRNKLLNNLVFYLCIAGLIGFIFLYLISEYLLPHLYSRSYTDAFKLIPLLAVGFLAQPFYLKANYSLIYERKTFTIASISIIASMLNIVLNFLLIPKYGLLAAVYSTIFSNILQFGAFTFIAERFKFKKDTFDLLLLSSLISIYAFGYINSELMVLFIVVFIFYRRKSSYGRYA